MFMQETVTLLGERRKLSTPDRPALLGQIIVGIESADGTTIRLREGDPRYPAPHFREAKRTSLTLEQARIGRLINFYDRIFVRGEAHDYDCTGFALYVAGARDEFTRGDFKSQFGFEPYSVHPNDVVEGVPYAISDYTGQSVHAQIGASSPTHSLCVIGRSIDGGGLMVYAANVHLMDVYRGVGLSEITHNDGRRLSR